MKNRYLIKLSGEFLKGSDNSTLSWKNIDSFCKKMKNIISRGAQMGFVIGGGNVFRGASGNIENYDRNIGDQIGMMATVINGLSLVERFRANGVPAIIQSGIEVNGVAKLFNRDKIEECFQKKGIVVFCGGLGVPYFSTDTTSVIRALQIEAEYVLKATKVDGIYNSDPVKNKNAEKYDKISFDEMISMNLGIMDLSAVLLMKKNNLKLMVFNMNNFTEFENACSGKRTGTVVEN